MRTHLIHAVSGIKFSDVEQKTLDNGKEYYVRDLSISYIDGYGNTQTELFTMFSDDGYALVSQDNEAQQLLKAA